MNERHEGKHLRRQEAKKRWKTILAVFLSVVLVMQSSNIQAFADVLASGGSEGRDEVVMDPAAEDTGAQGEVTTPEETNTADEQASSQDDAEQTVAETEENPVETTAQDTEATTPDGQSDQAQSEQAPAEETDTTVTLNVEVSAATLKYSAQDGTEKSVTSETDPKSVDVPNTLDFTFTVAPDDGQQVSSVAYAGTELAANDSGEYTIAAADLTDGEKIVVTTEAVPTEEPAEDAIPVESEEATEEGAPTEGEDVAKAEEVANGVIDAIDSVASSLLVSRVAPSSIQVTRKIVGNDEYSKIVSLDLSSLPLTLDANVAQPPELSDGNTYEFAYARVGRTNVASINYDAATDQLYLGIEGNSLSGILIDIEDSSQIVLWYEPHVDEYGVTYVITCDGEPVEDASSVGSLVGRDSIKEGETLQFTFAPNEGYEITNVTATNGNVSGESGAYSLSSVTDGTTVTIELTEKTAYDFTFHESSNTDFKGTDATGGTVEFSSSQGGSFTYLRGDNISFTLKANMQNDGNSKALNKVTLSIGSYQNMALNIPTGNNLQVGASETTYLANGMVATVELIDLGHWEEHFGIIVTDSGYLPEFRVTLSKGSCDAVRGDITLSTNFKDVETQEVWAKDLVGTELYVSSKQSNGAIWPFEKWNYVYETLDPSKFDFVTIHRDDTYVYVHVLPGFDAENVTLTVFIDGVANNSYKLEEISEGQQTPNIGNALADGCQYYVVIPESETGKDIRISAMATSEERQFAVAFKDYDGAPGTLGATYSVGDSISVDDGCDVYPTQEGKVFQGWKIENDASGTVYLPGDPFTITSDNQGLAKLDDHGRYVYTFVPVWADADEAVSAPYEVNVYFEQDDGSYPETPDVAFSENGPYGQTAFLIEEKLNEQLATEEGLPENWQEGYEIDVEKSGNLQVEVTGSSSINIYYKKKANDVTYKFVSGTAGEDLPSDGMPAAPAKAEDVKYGADVTLPTPDPASVTDARGVWEFQGWTVSPSSKVSEGQFSMPAGNATVTGTWQLKADSSDDYTVTYQMVSADADEALPAELAARAPEDEATYKYGQTVTIAGADTSSFTDARGVWEFQGWTVSPSSKVSEGQFSMPAGNATVTGTWQLKAESVKSYGVTYEWIGDVPSGIEDVPAGAVYKYGTNQTVATEPYSAGETFTDASGTWTFNGWTTDDATVANGQFRMPANDVVFTGSWTLTTVNISGPEVTVNSPQDVPYNGTNQTWVPTVTDGNKVLVAGTDYEVSYSTDDHTNVTGTIRVTITGKGNYTGSVERYYQITPLTITVTPRDIRKTQGQADPTLTSDYSGYLRGETAGWTGALTREPGEAVGTYTISKGSLQLADNPAGNFLAQNYILVVNEGTFTIVAAPVTPGGGDTPTPTPGGGGDGTPTPGTPATVTPADDTTTDEAAPEETIADDENALAAPTDTIGDDDTPLAAGAKDEDCWVHWLILLGMILSAVYFVGVGVRRHKFTSSLLGYEDKVLGNDRDNA